MPTSPTAKSKALRKPLEKDVDDGSGFSWSPEVRRMASTPGFISGATATKLRFMYAKECFNWNLSKASDLSRFCFMGDFEGVRKLLQANPELLYCGSDRPKVGYVTILILGAQADSYTEKYYRMQRKKLLQYLCELGCPVDHPDIVDFTAIFYTILDNPQLDLAKILLANGANINHQTKFGSTPLMEATKNCGLEAVQFLLDNGADLDICDANGSSAEGMYRNYGSKMIAIVENCKRKRAGVQAPLQDKKCAKCGVEKKEKSKLQFCGRCRLTQYCSKECQKAHWKDHKSACMESLEQKVIVLKPNYEKKYKIVPFVPLIPRRLGKTHVEVQGSRPTENVTSGTNMILKVVFSQTYLLVHDRHQTFICSIRSEENPGKFEEVADVIRKKGVPAFPGEPGVELYLLGDLKNPDELVLKLGNVLAEQPF